MFKFFYPLGIALPLIIIFGFPATFDITSNYTWYFFISDYFLFCQITNPPMFSWLKVIIWSCNLWRALQLLQTFATLLDHFFQCPSQYLELVSLQKIRLFFKSFSSIYALLDKNRINTHYFIWINLFFVNWQICFLWKIYLAFY